MSKSVAVLVLVTCVCMGKNAFNDYEMFFIHNILILPVSTASGWVHFLISAFILYLIALYVGGVNNYLIFQYAVCSIGVV